MNQFVYNNRIFYFDSAKYSVSGNNQNNTNINNYYFPLPQENIQPNVINLVIKVVSPPKQIILPKQKKVSLSSKKETVAGKGYIAAKFLNKVR